MGRKNPPRHEHDCDACVYLGQYRQYDLYVCKAIQPTVVARHGPHGDYMSGLGFSYGTHWGSAPLRIARERAEAKGLLPVKLDGTAATAVSMMTGLTEEQLDDLGGFPEEN